MPLTEDYLTYLANTIVSTDPAFHLQCIAPLQSHGASLLTHSLLCEVAIKVHTVPETEANGKVEACSLAILAASLIAIAGHRFDEIADLHVTVGGLWPCPIYSRTLDGTYICNH